MLEKFPPTLGKALRGIRSGTEDLVAADSEVTGSNAVIEVASLAFEDNHPMPAKYTADGAGWSPPLQWHGIPSNAAAVVLLIEDADSPTPAPLVHAIAWNLPGEDGGLAENALRRSEQDQTAPAAMGKNSYLQTTYLPPDPPPGHGPHRYVFQIFAVDAALSFETPPGRHALVHALRGRVLAKGFLIGTYERNPEQPVEVSDVDAVIEATTS